jgi:hypothetical protein
MTPLVQHSSLTSEHYSPAEIVEPGRRLFGGTIDLDPASCALANETVRATRFYTREEDGLTRPWFGRVWLNPPGGKDEGGSVQKAWWWRVARAWALGEIEQAIFVCFNLGLLQTTQLERPSGLNIPLDFPICFPAKRIPYNIAEEPDGKSGQPSLFAELAPAPSVKSGTQPPGASAFVYLPPRLSSVAFIKGPRAFQREYSPIGQCVWTREDW